MKKIFFVDMSWLFVKKFLHFRMEFVFLFKIASACVQFSCVWADASRFCDWTGNGANCWQWDLHEHRQRHTPASNVRRMLRQTQTKQLFRVSKMKKRRAREEVVTGFANKPNRIKFSKMKTRFISIICMLGSTCPWHTLTLGTEDQRANLKTPERSNSWERKRASPVSEMVVYKVESTQKKDYVGKWKGRLACARIALKTGDLCRPEVGHLQGWVEIQHRRTESTNESLSFFPFSPPSRPALLFSTDYFWLFNNNVGNQKRRSRPRTAFDRKNENVMLNESHFCHHRDAIKSSEKLLKVIQLTHMRSCGQEHECKRMNTSLTKQRKFW